ncbi:MAG: alpha/beta hydrolase [Candidatus Kariarchaeaceae archaeon]|jgi:pimeloyl-ACP methyl ester carboxylesterase
MALLEIALGFAIVIVSFVIIYFLSIIVIGELYFQVSRHRKYPIDPRELGAKAIVLRDLDQRRIIAWYKPTQEKNLAIIVHGHFDNAGMMFERYTPLFTENNWDVLTLDLRNHGLSDDDFPLTYGVRESFDVKLAINWARKKKKWQKLVIFGTSMGSIAGLLAANKTNGNINGLILDSSFVSIEKTLELNLAKHRLPIQIYVEPLTKYLEIRYRKINYSFSYYPKIEDHLVKASSRFPIFIARGMLDHEVANEDYFIMKRLIPNETHVLIPDGKHSRLGKSRLFRKRLQSWLKNL